MSWCVSLGESPLPVTEEKAISYTVTLACEGMQAATVKYHLAGLRQAQVKAGLPIPDWSAMAKLSQIRTGLARHRAVQGRVQLQRDPVKLEHMVALQAVWGRSGDRGVMLWAAACLCFFGCLRAGETLAPDCEGFDPKAHLTWEDVELESFKQAKWIRVKIKESKTDRLRQGAFVTGRTHQQVCVSSDGTAEVYGVEKSWPGAVFHGWR